MALSGCMSVAGEPDKPPLRVTHPQASYWAGTYAAAGTVLALIHRGNTGEGQQVDVSAQAALISALGHAPSFWDLNREDQKRHGVYLVGRSVTGAKMQVLWPCRDGYLNFIIYGGETGRKTNQALVKWMLEKGMDVPDFLREKDWARFNIATVTQEEIDRIETVIGPFFAQVTKDEFYKGVIDRDMLGFPVGTPGDMLKDPHLDARGFWQPIHHPELDATLSYPGPFTHFPDIEMGPRHRAPKLGEHNEAIYRDELGLSRDEILELYEGRVI
jgi:crotonobetainyl-CoA:carnitine CoA-transferase CaiB-like acyl-CoA transferase